MKSSSTKLMAICIILSIYFGLVTVMPLCYPTKDSETLPYLIIRIDKSYAAFIQLIGVFGPLILIAGLINPYIKTDDEKGEKQ